ncbi:6127_t:CDS:2, partial [Racocetra persica]
VSEQCCYIPQSFIKEFVKNCTIYATQRTFPNLVAAKPIISNAFLNRVQDHYTQYSWARALTSKWPIEVPDVHIINRCPRHPQSQGLVKHANNILQQKVSKWIEDIQRRDWVHAILLCCLNDDKMVNNDERVDYDKMVNNDEIVDENEMVDDDKRVDNDERVHNDKSVNDKRVDNERVDDDERVDIERENYRSVYNERVNDKG